MLIPVIMAGGAGTRLWPLSRRMFPKQFLPLTGERSMFQETLLRLDGLERSPAIVVCNQEHRFLVAEQLHGLEETEGTIILEPVGRNTAPAIAVAALKALEQDDDPLLLILAADHIIADQQGFQTAIHKAEKLAVNDHLITFGIAPTSPETGYGYIRRGESMGEGYKVDKFVENQTLIRLSNTYPSEIIIGIVACSCFEQNATFKNSNVFIRKFSLPVEPRLKRGILIWISFGSMQMRSKKYPQNLSTTQLWSRRNLLQ